MDTLSGIRLMWDEWKAVPFPSELGGKDVAGICVSSLDTYAAGCIDTFVSRNGHLDKGRISILKECRNELAVVVASLDGPAQDYFNDLLILTRRVLQFVAD